VEDSRARFLWAGQGKGDRREEGVKARARDKEKEQRTADHIPSES
jgi:hypothetical protein